MLSPITSSVAAPQVSAAPAPLSISVVIAWVNPLDLLLPGLHALHTQDGRRADEIIIVTRRGQDEQDRLCRLFPDVILLSAPRHTPITALRAQGIRRSRGDLVAITEDHCVPAPDWLACIRERMQRADCGIVGGPVENGADMRLRDWAAFLTEYAGAVASAAPAYSARSLPGNNVAYRRDLALGLCDYLDRGLWESFYHPQLQSRLLYEPQMVVYHQRPFGFRYFIGQRFDFTRSFAAMRSQSLTSAGRLRIAAACFALPPLLWLRGLRTLLRKRRLVGLYLVCSPLIGIYLSVGAAGEMLGYLRGGGQSLERVE